MFLLILQMLKITIVSNRPIMLLKKLFWDSKNGKNIYCVLKAKPSLKSVNLNGTRIPSATLFFSTKFCSGIRNFHGQNERTFGWTKLLSRSVLKGSCRIRLLDLSVKVVTNIKNLKYYYLEIKSWKSIQVIHW